MAHCVSLFLPSLSRAGWEDEAFPQSCNPGAVCTLLISHSATTCPSCYNLVKARERINIVSCSQ